MGFDFSRVRQGLRERTNETVQSVANDIGTFAIQFSRLDTGRTRRSWSASIEAPLPMNIDPIQAGIRRSTARRNANSEAAQRQIQSTVATFDIRNDDFIFISNGVDYFARVWNNVDSTAINAIRSAQLRARQ